MIKKKVTEDSLSKITNLGKINDYNVINVGKFLVDNFAQNVIIYDVQNKTPFVSYYIVASSKNDYRMKKLVLDAKEALIKYGYEIDHVEGKNKSKWILIDSKDVVVQLFTKEERNNVKFDELYLDCNHMIIESK